MKINSKISNIELRHIRAVHAIAQEGSFSAGASSLGIVPSALSEIIRQVEEEIGAPLFNRRTRPPTMTPLGFDFLSETAPVLDGMARSFVRLRQKVKLETGLLSVGASPSAISGLVAPVLTAFLAARPGVECFLHDDLAERLAKMVSEGLLDVAVAGRARYSPDLYQREIMRDPVGLACSAEHPLALREQIFLHDIEARSLIRLAPDTGSQQLLDECASIPREFLSTGLSAYSTVAQLCMVRAGLGVALLPRNAARLFHDPDIVFREIKDLDLWRKLYLIEPARRPLSLLASAFITLLDQHSLEA